MSEWVGGNKTETTTERRAGERGHWAPDAGRLPVYKTSPNGLPKAAQVYAMFGDCVTPFGRRLLSSLWSWCARCPFRFSARLGPSRQFAVRLRRCGSVGRRRHVGIC